MANNCYFEMKIAGPEKSVHECVKMLRHEGPYLNGGLGRVFSFVVIDEPEKDPATGNIAIHGAGDCAWSIKSAIIEWSPFNLENVSEKLGLVIEAYSSEPGCRFQEHVLVNKGEFVAHGSVKYTEYWIEGATEDYIQEVLVENGLSREVLMSKLNDNGDYCVGGFDNFGEFENLFAYFEPEQKPSLSSQISSAESRAEAARSTCNEKIPTKEPEPAK